MKAPLVHTFKVTETEQASDTRQLDAKKISNNVDESQYIHVCVFFSFLRFRRGQYPVSMPHLTYNLAFSADRAQTSINNFC